MPRVTYVFCHGLNGCGQYDEKYEKEPYWGQRPRNDCSLRGRQRLVVPGKR